MSTKRLNPNQNSTNNMLDLPASICDCGDTETCNHSGTATQVPATLYESVSIDDKPYATTDPTLTVADTVEVRAQISAALKLAGYYNINNLTYTYDGTAWTISHTGEATINSLIFGGVTTALTAACTPAIYCDYEIVYAGNVALSEITYNGVSTPFVNILTYPTSTLEEVEAEVALGLPAGTVITVTNEGAGWVVTPSLPQGSTVSIDGKDGISCACYTVYVA